MNDPDSAGGRLPLASLDVTKPNVARVYDYLTGGKDNFSDMPDTPTVITRPDSAIWSSVVLSVITFGELPGGLRGRAGSGSITGTGIGQGGGSGAGRR
jgi:uncharacterized spore protein YtfJ